MKILLVVYDNDSHIHWFPQGLAYIAAILRHNDHQVEVYNQDIYHYPETHLTSYLDNNHFDAIGVSIIAGYYQHKKLLAIAKAINNSKHRPDHFIIGGHGPTPDPEYFLRKAEADFIVMGEGEETIIDLLNTIENKGKLEDVRGIAHKNGNEVFINERRPLIEDIDTIPWPAYDLFPIEVYRLLRMPHISNNEFCMPILSGRGCTFTCNFCYRMDQGFRPRSADSIVEEIRYLQTEYNIRYFAFSDELLMSSKKRTEEICRAFLHARLKIKWDCNGRLNYADKDILKLMKESGCVFINYGIESFDDQILKNMNKALTTKQIVRGIENTLEAGISPGFNVIFGNIDENRRTLQQGVDFLLKYDDGAQMRTIRPVTPYPGSPLYDLAIEQGLIKDTEDFYANKHLNSDLLCVNFTELSDEEFYEALTEANVTLLENYFDKKKISIREQTEALYTNRDASFRGFRQS